MGTKYIGSWGSSNNWRVSRENFKILCFLLTMLTPTINYPVKWYHRFNGRLRTSSLTILLKLINRCANRFLWQHYSSNDLVCPENLYCGHCYSDKDVEYTGKWNELNWVTCNKYLPYCAGRPGYVLGSKLVHSLAKYGHILARDFITKMQQWDCGLHSISLPSDVVPASDWVSCFAFTGSTTLQSAACWSHLTN